MTRAGELETQRLWLRRWKPADLAPFAQLNADSKVMEFFVAPMTPAESDAFVDERINPHFDKYGYGLWAAERRDTGAFIGFIGLSWQDFDASFTPALEVGWRLARGQWGNGFATEGAAAAVDYAFQRAQVSEVVSMTTVHNHRSIAVMERLSMQRDPRDDFNHPRVPRGHHIAPHVLYRITASQWRERDRQEPR